MKNKQGQASTSDFSLPQKAENFTTNPAGKSKPRSSFPKRVSNLTMKKNGKNEINRTELPNQTAALPEIAQICQNKIHVQNPAPDR